MITLPDADATRDFGARLARMLRPGDVIVLTGPLGAGKTTLTQGIGEGLDVRGRVTSPTFTISRIHPSRSGAPDLVHVDAYRLTGLLDLETIDLDASIPETITIIEWGEGLIDELGVDYLQVTLDRSDDERRLATLTPVGARWESVPWEELARP
ncbi:tRNA (adenosine(37)-N6)-threonylcarbamoyltransferase complex ATPase subunit type 1 TsaE [Bowdeniella nasicola]|uniref:tRNA threonylcarbamoyladenosine biosynthesis protein TsaE n=1 Tax=Bowdeniella nasicola TaxID=208480 RepID=A0A1Q5Q5H8_9ACTO|nr:tRNA (adenosine(37)-N6)-threonylcarbamoyltransferase complex ATPase subunit type 1 TsaE [Bowdeniella nasicola]OKL55043.1 tRNA (adenosine(37)-N6)-threonylcarbamoyltransferase complex ATPase subunit type 1 TsaE [Bowdeniella nasicola]